MDDDEAVARCLAMEEQLAADEALALRLEGEWNAAPPPLPAFFNTGAPPDDDVPALVSDDSSNEESPSEEDEDGEEDKKGAPPDDDVPVLVSDESLNEESLGEESSREEDEHRREDEGGEEDEDGEEDEGRRGSSHHAGDVTRGESSRILPRCVNLDLDDEPPVYIPRDQCPRSWVTGFTPDPAAKRQRLVSPAHDEKSTEETSAPGNDGLPQTVEGKAASVPVPSPVVRPPTPQPIIPPRPPPLPEVKLPPSNAPDNGHPKTEHAWKPRSPSPLKAIVWNADSNEEPLPSTSDTLRSGSAVDIPFAAKHPGPEKPKRKPHLKAYVPQGTARGKDRSPPAPKSPRPSRLPKPSKQQMPPKPLRPLKMPPFYYETRLREQQESQPPETGPDFWRSRPIKGQLEGTVSLGDHPGTRPVEVRPGPSAETTTMVMYHKPQNWRVARVKWDTVTVDRIGPTRGTRAVSGDLLELRRRREARRRQCEKERKLTEKRAELDRLGKEIASELEAQEAGPRRLEKLLKNLAVAGLEAMEEGVEVEQVEYAEGSREAPVLECVDSPTNDTCEMPAPFLYYED